MAVFCTHPGEAFNLVEACVGNLALREMVEMDGGAWPGGGLADRIEYLQAFSECWDRRRGDLRLVFHHGDESRTDGRARRVYAAAEALGLLAPPPPTLTAPDFVLILGGLATGVEPRVRYAAELINTGRVVCDHVVGLGSFRPIDDRERPAADRYAPAARHELDLLAAMTATAFDLPNAWSSTSGGDPERDPRRAHTRLDAHEASRRLTVMAARSGQPDERPANTADTYRQFAAELLDAETTAVLIITSSIYVPYQHVDAVRALGVPHQVVIETIGVPSRSQTPSHPPSSYLQEMRSMIRSAAALADTFHANDRPPQ